MKKLLFALLLLTAHMGYAAPAAINLQPIHEAFVLPNRGLAPQELVNRAPPAPIAENPPPQPFPQAIWIPGYWFWLNERQDFIWICGVWRLPPPERIWAPGHWKEIENGWTYICGAWLTDPARAPWIFSAAPPPSPQNEPTSEPPSNGYFWFPGYWELNSSTNAFQWLGGSWQKFTPKWVIEPAHWVWRQEGFLFVPTYWDWVLDERGRAYDCTTHAILDAPFIAQQLIYCYADHLPLCSYYWFYNPSIWQECSCTPPWWEWTEWWSIPWDGQYWLWWWWCHPGFPAPPWLPHDIIVLIPGPSPIVVNLFATVPLPWFMAPFGVPSFEMWMDAIGKSKLPLLSPAERLKMIDLLKAKLPPSDTARPGGTQRIGNVPKPLPAGKQTPATRPNSLPHVPSATFPSTPQAVAPVPVLPEVGAPVFYPEIQYQPPGRGSYEQIPDTTPYSPFPNGWDYPSRQWNDHGGGHRNGNGHGHDGGHRRPDDSHKQDSNKGDHGHRRDHQGDRGQGQKGDAGRQGRDGGRRTAPDRKSANQGKSRDDSKSK